MANLVNAKQLKAARALAGLTQADLGEALGVNERQVRFWERAKDRPPASRRWAPKIERVLRANGVEVFAEPSPGVRFATEQ